VQTRFHRIVAFSDRNLRHASREVFKVFAMGKLPRAESGAGNSPCMLNCSGGNAVCLRATLFGECVVGVLRPSPSESVLRWLAAQERTAVFRMAVTQARCYMEWKCCPP
jgi:hypothetical protein